MYVASIFFSFHAELTSTAHSGQHHFLRALWFCYATSRPVQNPHTGKAVQRCEADNVNDAKLRIASHTELQCLRPAHCRCYFMLGVGSRKIGSTTHCLWPLPSRQKHFRVIVALDPSFEFSELINMGDPFLGGYWLFNRKTHVVGGPYKSRSRMTIKTLIHAPVGSFLAASSPASGSC